VIRDEHDVPPPEEVIEDNPEVSYEDIPFEIQRPKDDDDAQMTLF
jgi:hypothetical protein